MVLLYIHQRMVVQHIQIPKSAPKIGKEQGRSHGHASRWPILTQISHPTKENKNPTMGQRPTQFNGSKRPTKSLVLICCINWY